MLAACGTDPFPDREAVARSRAFTDRHGRALNGDTVAVGRLV